MGALVSPPERLHAAERPSATEPLRLRPVALPMEHGGWGMLGEPLLLGLLVHASLPGLGVALAATFAFLARHPLKLALADRRAGRRHPRTAAAERFALLYAGLAAASLPLAARGADGWWIAPLVAAPLALFQFARDVRHEGRALLPELLGGIALGSVASAELMAAGWDAPAAFALWGLLAAKAAGAILYVRARLRCDRGLSFSRTPAILAHGLGIAAALAGAAAGLVPWLAAVAFLALLLRAAHGLSRFHRKVRPQTVGLTEMAYGLAFVLAIALGYAVEG